jgi:hypothetical protein
MVVVEAEELQVHSPGWRALPYGTNYYAATFANTFLSRQAYLGAPEHGPLTEAGVDIRVPTAGRYLALVRYEAAYRFETRFRLRIEQANQTRLDRLYGSLDNLKVFAFGTGLQRDHINDWGGADSIVWEGNDAYVDLQPGVAHLTLVADDQPEPAARRNVDVIVLTTDEEDVKTRLAKEPYLPLDGLLTQAGDAFLRVHNHGPAMKIHVGNGAEHSPYWVHIRDWKPLDLEVGAQQVTDWVEVGSLLDSLSGGQWAPTVTSKEPASYDLEFGIRDEYGRIESVRTLPGAPQDRTWLAYSGDLRYSRRIRAQEEALDGLIDALKATPVHGRPPTIVPIYGYSIDKTNRDPAFQAKVDEFVQLTGANRVTTTTITTSPALRMMNWRGIPPAQMDAECKKLRAQMDPASVEVVTLGDEINIPYPSPGAKTNDGFRAWLRAQHVAPQSVDPAMTAYDGIVYDVSPKTAAGRPTLFYYSSIYAFRYGERVMGDMTSGAQKCFTHAGIGANFSPQQGPLYLGATHQWISAFRNGALTMPWSEDYIFQVPVGSPQDNLLAVDMMRAGIRGKPSEKIQYYVHAHMPGNTTGDWRRLFYGDLAHGVKAFNLFEFRPLEFAYTENHVDRAEMYQAVRVALHELGTFEDLVPDSTVRRAPAALWFSETGDVWTDKKSPFDVNERALYLMLRQHQIPLDVVVEGDDLSGYAALFLTDEHVSLAASRAIASWVQRGGQLVATAGAGTRDEFDRPNAILPRLFGIEPAPYEKDTQHPIRWEKQDMAYASAMDHVGTDGGKSIAVLSLRAPFQSRGATVTGHFDDGRPAMTSRRVGAGTARYLGFFPALSYLQPAYPRRPFDRSSEDTAMCHLLPTAFDENAAETMRVEVSRPVVSSEPLVETTVLQSPRGLIIPLVNWSGKPIQGLTVTVRIPVPPRAALATGGNVDAQVHGAETTFTLDLDVADALVLRSP